MKVVVTHAAFADLLRIGREIQKDNPVRAETFVAELYDCCQRLSLMPKAFALMPNWEDRGVRRQVHGNYLIFYRVSEDRVEVLHILHAAMDYVQVLFPDG